jgi:methylenetetrahydrofolate dehydrogenase (NADP+)/methenyltetrahydrofolate cyclohydrolase
MAAQIIDGAAQAAKVKQQIKSQVADLRARGRNVKLTAVLIGPTPAAQMYAKRQGETCAEVGIDYELLSLPADTTRQQALDAIARLNADSRVSGIMLHMPVPEALDSIELQCAIEPAKDVEGVNPANLGFLILGRAVNVPCTALAAFELVKSTGVTMRGAEACVIGASEIVGKPVAMLLSDQRATVRMCRSATRDLAGHTRAAEILVVAVGKPHFIAGEHVRDGAVVVDVGINRITLPDGAKKTVGDVDFEAARQKAGWITPVPGGVGPMTVAMLLRNTVQSAAKGAGG